MRIIISTFVLIFLADAYAYGVEPSADTQVCLECHQTIHPGIVTDWGRSRHARTKPIEGMEKPDMIKRISATTVPEELLETTVGCAECHTLNPKAHSDTFEHNGYKVHLVVSPEDCATCHPEERNQYSENIMSRAHGNLVGNPVYKDLAMQINGTQAYKSDLKSLTVKAPDAATEAVSCLFCHGTRVGVKGSVTRETDFGEITVPVLYGWPNQGVGRINPDNTIGACTSCHTRHRFSIEMARKPHTCAQCHKGPDVPGYKVYDVSKHGNIYSSMKDKWNFSAVPWKLGQDFEAPTCAACHVSLTVDQEGIVIAERTHRMNDRLAWRLFGIYAHPHPESPDTTLLRNRAGMPLPTDLDGKPAPQGLIGEDEQAIRRAGMTAVCLSCHGRGWVDNQFAYLKRTIETSNDMTLVATQAMMSAWKNGYAKGIDQNSSIFDEAIEQKWAEQWLFYANSTRYASAMMGGDYGVFDNGRWFMARNVRDILEWLRMAEQIKAIQKGIAE